MKKYIDMTVVDGLFGWIDGEEILEKKNNWQSAMQEMPDVVFFSAKEEAMKTLNFYELPIEEIKKMMSINLPTE